MHSILCIAYRLPAVNALMINARWYIFQNDLKIELIWIYDAFHFDTKKARVRFGGNGSVLWKADFKQPIRLTAKGKNVATLNETEIYCKWHDKEICTREKYGHRSWATFPFGPRRCETDIKHRIKFHFKMSLSRASNDRVWPAERFFVLDAALSFDTIFPRIKCSVCAAGFLLCSFVAV